MKKIEFLYLSQEEVIEVGLTMPDTISIVEDVLKEHGLRHFENPDFLNFLESDRNNGTRTRNHRLAVIKSFAKMKKPYPAWFFPLQAVFTHVGGFSST